MTKEIIAIDKFIEGINKLGKDNMEFADDLAGTVKVDMEAYTLIDLAIQSIGLSMSLLEKAKSKLSLIKAWEN